MEVRFSGSLSEDDYIKGKKQLLKTRKVFVILGTIPILVSIPALSFSSEVRREPWVLLVALIVYPLLFGYALRLQKRNIKNSWKSNKAVKQRFSGLVNQQGIFQKSDLGNSNKTWDYFLKYRLMPGFVLLYLSSELIEIYPRSLFDNEADWESFVELVKKNVPSK